MHSISIIIIIRLLTLPSVESQAGGCRWPGAFYLDGNCFLYNSSLLTYDAAQSSCALIGGVLAKITNLNQINTVAALADQYKSIWIGANDRAVEGTWRWDATGALATELTGLWDTNFNQPDNEMGNEYCADIFITSCFTGRVWDDPCIMEYPFVCMDNGFTANDTFSTKITTEITSTHSTAIAAKTTTPQARCRWSGSVHVDGGCFLYNTTKLSYDAAKAYCLSIGGVLATITTSEQVNAITSTSNKDDSMWIGANDKASEGTWRWEDTGALAIELSGLWDLTDDQPDNLNNDDCADIFISTCTHRMVWDDPCTEKYGFICMEKDIITTKTTITYTTGSLFINGNSTSTEKSTATTVQTLLSTTPVQALSSTTPFQTLPSTTPVQTLPSTTPFPTLPSTTPVQTLPTTTTVQTLPSTTSVQALSSTKAVQTLPSTTPVQTLPSTTPVQTLPSTTPVQTLSSTTPFQILPSTTPVQTLPSTTTVQTLPSTTPVQTTDYNVTREPGLELANTKTTTISSGNCGNTMTKIGNHIYTTDHNGVDGIASKCTAISLLGFIFVLLKQLNVS